MSWRAGMALAFELAALSGLAVRCSDSGSSNAGADAGRIPDDVVVDAPLESDAKSASDSMFPDAGGDAGDAAFCQQDLKVSPQCVHPKVVADCSNNWCKIPAGCFIMGSPSCEAVRAKYSEEQSETTLTHPFEVMQREVTQAEWTQFGWPNPSGLDDAGRGDCVAANCAVGNVTWDEALAYANRLSKAKGLAECYALLSLIHI